METDRLRTELVALAKALEPAGVQLMLTGGFALILREEHVLRSGRHSGFAALPATRSTDDVDLMLTTEIVVNRKAFDAIRSALETRGYMPHPGAVAWQWVEADKFQRSERGVKFDIQAPPVPDNLSGLVERKKGRIPRIKPVGAEGFHARETFEASGVEEEALEIGIGADGGPPTVLIPHPYHHGILKLFAFRDKLLIHRPMLPDEHDEKDLLGRHHAFDLYRLLVLATEEEFSAAEQMRERNASKKHVIEAREIVATLFNGPDSVGVAEVRAFPGGSFRLAPRDVEEFLRRLQFLYPACL